MHIRKLIKNIAAHSPIPITKNEYYNRLTEKVIEKVCIDNCVCVDVGANEGKILNMFTKHAPNAIHYAFEPIPMLYHLLKRKYSSAAKIFDIALSDHAGMSNFNYVISDPAYSGLKKRAYDKPETDEQIEVKTATLDSIIPSNESIKLIKLDIEGGEYNALRGAANILESSHPYILFEFGRAGGEAYHVSPGMMYELLKSFKYKINLLQRFLRQAPELSLHAFKEYYTNSKEYFFIAYI